MKMESSVVGFAAERKLLNLCWGGHDCGIGWNGPHSHGRARCYN
jgi:hypothetical protein